MSLQHLLGVAIFCIALGLLVGPGMFRHKRVNWQLKYQAWFKRTTGFLRYVAVLAQVLPSMLLFVLALDVGFDYHYLGANYRQPQSYIVIVLFVVVVGACVTFTSSLIYGNKEQSVVDDDWLLWDKASDEKATSNSAQTLP